MPLLASAAKKKRINKEKKYIPGRLRALRGRLLNVALASLSHHNYF